MQEELNGALQRAHAGRRDAKDSADHQADTP
jgi:hypothetical protein